MITIERELFALLPKGVTEIMPNHCHNRVTFYSANTEDVAKLKRIFTDENVFLKQLLLDIANNTEYNKDEAYNKLIARYNIKN